MRIVVHNLSMESKWTSWNSRAIRRFVGELQSRHSKHSFKFRAFRANSKWARDGQVVRCWRFKLNHSKHGQKSSWTSLHRKYALHTMQQAKRERGLNTRNFLSYVYHKHSTSMVALHTAARAIQWGLSEVLVKLHWSHNELSVRGAIENWRN